jgi:hypothetical protein
MRKILFLLGFVALANLATADQVKVMMKDGTVLHGDMLGIDGGVLSLQTGNKSKDIPVANIKKVFDANGKSISLGDAGVAAAAAASDDTAPQEPARPARRAKRVAQRSGRNGAKMAGAIMGWSGLGVFLLGDVVYFAGASEASSATSTYYTSEYYGYADYEIDNKWYTYSQYTAYEEGLGYEVTGAVIAVVGAAVCLTGFIVEASAHEPRVNDDGALLDIHDGQLAWGVPELNVTNRLGTQATLVSAQF